MEKESHLMYFDNTKVPTLSQEAKTQGQKVIL